MALHWEQLEKTLVDGTVDVRTVHRAKIPGGWLVRLVRNVQYQFSQQPVVSESLTFVPDPTHAWDGNSVP